MSTLERNGIASECPAPVVSQVRPQSQFDDVVRQFESTATELGIHRFAHLELSDLCGKVAALTAAIFPGEFNLEVRGDPEIAGELHFTFEVTSGGTIDEIVARNDQWHRELRLTVGNHAALFCLCIDVR